MPVAKEERMGLKMGRMTKRNRAKYRRRAYEAGMLGQQATPRTSARPTPWFDRPPRDIGGKRAA